MTSRMRFPTVVLIASLLSSSTLAQVDVSKPTSTDVVLEWNAIAMSAVTTQNGVEQVRLAAITHLAIFEAVNAIVGDFKPYLGTIVAPPDASTEAAVVAAAHGVLHNYLVDQRDSLGRLREASLARIPDSPAKASGIAAGEAAATAMVAHRDNDGSLPVEWHVPGPDRPGEWQPTPTCPPQGGLFLHWRNVKPFGIARGDQFRVPPPPPLTSYWFAKDYNEVKRLGSKESEERPDDRAVVARFFAAVQSQHAWNPIARQLAQARRTSLSTNARMFALLNMAMNDALIAVIDAKYHYTFWRPETAIRAGDTDGNPYTEPDVTFEPFIAAPCHPSYPSAHASASYSAREVLDQFFGNWGHAITLASDAIPGVELHYTRLDKITRDIDDARIYGGIHFRSDQLAGGWQGRLVGWYVVANNLRRTHHAK